MSYIFNLALVSCIAAFTPGPNNAMLMQSGIYFGIRKTLPHIYGVILGFNVLFFSIHMGINIILVRFPMMNIILKIIGTIYFLYFAYRIIFMSIPVKDVEDTSHTGTRKPLRFWVAFSFQWINLKAWFFAISVIGSLPSQKTISTVIIAQVIISIATVGSAFTWTLGGVLVSKAFRNPLTLRIISIVLALSLVYIAIEQWI